MVRDDLGTAAEQGWAPEHIAAYFVETLQEQEIGECGRRFMRDYFEARADEDGWNPDLTDIAVHYRGGDADVGWDRLEDDLADYVVAEQDRIVDGVYDDGEGAGDATTPETVEEQVERLDVGPVCADTDAAWDEEVRITPGYVGTDALGDVDGEAMHVAYDPDDPRDVWLTSVYTRSCEDHEDDEVVYVDYMDEDVAKDAVGWMIDRQRLDRVHDLLEKCFRRGHREQAAGFVGVMVDEGHVLDAVAEVEEAARAGHLPDTGSFVDAVYDEDPAGADSFQQMIDHDTGHEV